MTKPILDERKAAAEQVARSGAHWQRWWRERGELELRCILMTAWDPIGVGDVPEAWDEYDGYAPAVAHRLRDAADSEDGVEQVANYLNHIERDYMNHWSEKRGQRNAQLADALVAWHEWSFTRGGRPPREWIDDD